MDLFGSSKILWELLWPFFILAVVIVIFKIIFEIVLPDLIENYRNKRKYREGGKWRNDRELLQWMKNLHPTEFEKYVAELFKNLGFKAQHVGKTHDGGIDVEIEKEGVKSYIQCKRYNGKSVSVSEVREFFGALADFLSEGKAYFVTTSIFTLEAEKYAEGKPIELVDGQKLVRYMHLADKNTEKIEVKTTEEKCPKCGSELIEKNGKFGNFLGCSTYPDCDFTKSI